MLNNVSLTGFCPCYFCALFCSVLCFNRILFSCLPHLGSYLLTLILQILTPKFLQNTFLDTQRLRWMLLLLQFPKHFVNTPILAFITQQLLACPPPQSDLISLKTKVISSSPFIQLLFFKNENTCSVSVSVLSTRETIVIRIDVGFTLIELCER